MLPIYRQTTYIQADYLLIFSYPTYIQEANLYTATYLYTATLPIYWQSTYIQAAYLYTATLPIYWQTKCIQAAYLYTGTPHILALYTAILPIYSCPTYI